MFYNLKILPEAKTNLQKIFLHYQQQQPSLGVDFRTHLFETIDYLGNNPKLFTRQYRHIRAAKISQYPFNIFYLVDEERAQIVILAVLEISDK